MLVIKFDNRPAENTAGHHISPNKKMKKFCFVRFSTKLPSLDFTFDSKAKNEKEKSVCRTMGHGYATVVPEWHVHHSTACRD